jgi:CRP-like cAMP-binding protein
LDSARDAVIPILVRKLSSLGELRDEDLRGLASLPFRLHNARAGDTVIRDGARIVECCLLVQGYACRHKLASNGGRQIVSFHLPGDMLDIQHLLFDRADHNVQMVTNARLAFFPMDALRTLVEDRPALGRALWRDCLVDASIFREWVLNVGRRDAKARIAHMLCEFVERHAAAGLGRPDQFRLPMTQEDIADATGLTSVHVNRMLRQLRDEGVIEGAGRQIGILSWERMKQIADFQPGYLHAVA